MNRTLARASALAFAPGGYPIDEPAVSTTIRVMRPGAAAVTVRVTR